MKITVISGSTRADSQSLKVSEYLKAELEKLGADAVILDLNEKRLPLFDDDLSGEWAKLWQPIEAELDSSDGFVFVSPEWDGMFSVGLHNLFNYVASGSSKKVMAHKPVTLTAVSDGMGGVYPLSQMRSIGPKNTHYLVTPENLRFAQVKDVLVDGEITVDGLRNRVEYSLKVLLEYAKALKEIRNSDVLDFKNFKNGV